MPTCRHRTRGMRPKMSDGRQGRPTAATGPPDRDVSTATFADIGTRRPRCGLGREARGECELCRAPPARPAPPPHGTMTKDVRRISRARAISGKKPAAEYRCCSPEGDGAKSWIKPDQCDTRRVPATRATRGRGDAAVGRHGGRTLVSRRSVARGRSRPGRRSCRPRRPSSRDPRDRGHTASPRPATPCRAPP